MDLNDLLGNNPVQEPAGVPQQPVAPTPTPAPAPNTVAPAQAGATPTTPAHTTPANNLGGGSRLSLVKNALMSASVGSQRNDISLGTAIYLLKSGKYSVTERKSVRLTNFSYVCLKGIKDGQGVPFGGPGYTGAIPGEEYSTALFHDGDYAFSSLLKAVSACFGWSPEKIKQMQSPERVDQLIRLIDMFSGVGAESCLPTNKPCCFSNQVILQMSAQSKISEVKVNGKPTYEKGSDVPITKAYTNTFWDKRIPIAEAVAGLAPEFIIKAFGSQEAITAALETEKQLDAFA